MLQAFQKQLSELAGNPSGKKFLLAVSGGIDSMLMAELFHASGYKFAMAHCNFGMRGKESDGDEAFVKACAGKYKVQCHTAHFDIKKVAAKRKVSIQMAARDLRYHWFNELKEKHKVDYIAIAHNSDDVVETFFINLMRGTGIAGLHGILANSKDVIRPLLNFSRKEIEAYGKKIKLKWREDSSNATDKYERNKIRHHLIPLLEEINHQSRKAIHQTIENLKGVESVYLEAIHKKLEDVLHNKGGKQYLSIAKLKKLDSPELYIYEAIKAHGFNYMQTKEMAETFQKQSGKVFLSNTHRITKDREHLIIEVIPANAKKQLSVSKESKLVSIPFADVSFYTEAIPAGFKPPASPTIACLDYTMLRFPLTLRKWAHGDRFCPLGMKKPKKVSDFLVDAKVSLPDKENTWVLLSGNDIAWVVGRRIDERFKVTVGTKKIYLCTLDYTPSL